MTDIPICPAYHQMPEAFGLKHLLRKAAARTQEAVCTAIAELPNAFTPDEGANYLTNSALTAPNSIPLQGASFG